MIDSLNGGQTCLQCRHYLQKSTRRDPFFGELPVQSYCSKFQRIVRPDVGEECPAFLKSLFDWSASK